MVRLADPIRLSDGTVTTCAELLNSGRGRLEKCDNWHSPRSATGLRTMYRVVVEDGGFFEIGKTAYLSRIGEKAF